MVNINWPEVIAGFLLGISPALLGTAWRGYKFLRDPARRKFVGRFWLYHWSIVQAGVIREKRLEVRFSWIRGTMRVRMPKDSVTGLTFEGEMVVAHGPVRYFALRGEGNEERLLVIANDPLNPEFRFTSGILAGVEMENTRPIACRTILSKEPLAAEALHELLGGRRLLKADPVWPKALPAISAQAAPAGPLAIVPDPQDGDSA